jgi:hypothetical protein
LSQADIDILIRASNWVDRLSNQGVSGANEHSMCEPLQPLGDCRSGIASTIDSNLAYAEDLGPSGLWYLGVALHTITDSTSPFHTDPNGDPLCWLCNPEVTISHILLEPGSREKYSSQINRAITLAQRTITNVKGSWARNGGGNHGGIFGFWSVDWINSPAPDPCPNGDCGSGPGSSGGGGGWTPSLTPRGNSDDD